MTSSGPERTVRGQVITSERDPAVRIELPESVDYAGADRWVLYDLADCELHVFVEADEQRIVRRLYWVQFEQYVPSRPDAQHHYDSPRHAWIGGLDFYVDTWARDESFQTPPGSDLEHVESLLRAAGFRTPAGMLSVRLVHLLDEQKRKELMIIYSEDVEPTGASVAELSPGGAAHQRWQAIEDGLVERATTRISVLPTG